jgi:hypothetical protein
MENDEALRKARSEAARLLGQARSPKKAAAVRENGKLGGRPKAPARVTVLFTPNPNQETR